MPTPNFNRRRSPDHEQPTQFPSQRHEMRADLSNLSIFRRHSKKSQEPHRVNHTRVGGSFGLISPYLQGHHTRARPPFGGGPSEHCIKTVAREGGEGLGCVLLGLYYQWQPPVVYLRRAGNNLGTRTGVRAQRSVDRGRRRPDSPPRAGLKVVSAGVGPRCDSTITLSLNSLNFRP